MMKKRILVIFICITLMLTACAPKDNGVVLAIGEEAGKAAGLALINQAFDVNKTEASVEYQASAGEIFHDGTTGKEVTLEPDRVYVVKTVPDEGKTDYYYAEVDAVTGAAYRAERYLSGIVLSAEQKTQAEALGTLDAFDPDSLLDIQRNAMAIVESLIQERLEKEVPLLRMYPDMIESDSVDFPKVRLEYFVIMENGKVYYLTLCWPTMELVQVYIRY